MFRLFFWEKAWPHKLHTKGRSFLRTGNAQAVTPRVVHAADGPTELPVDGFDVHLQAVPTGRPMTALLAHERLFSPVFRCFVHAQLRTRQEGFGTLGTLQREAFQRTHAQVSPPRGCDPAQ